MTTRSVTLAPARFAADRPISIAVLAMGGQGGGVLSDWIVALAEAAGWVGQSTSIPGVAQRTGATIYYIEMLQAKDGKRPILSLMPTPGDVDLVLAAEFMEAGRSMLRGLVTPDRTTLITSDHRAFAVSEKERPGDGRGDPGTVVAAAGIAARRVISFDMQALAERSGSVISAALFGALAASGGLPFPRAAFEAVIRGGGKGVDASLRAFSAAYDRTQEPSPPAIVQARPAVPSANGHPALDRIVARIHTGFPVQAQAMVLAGSKRLVEYQDLKYADDYLDRLDRLERLDEQNGGAAKDYAFTTACAKYLAVAMAYDDVIRVADLKTRASRFDRVRREVGSKSGQLVYTTEYMHPRMDEVIGMMPAPLGRLLQRLPGLTRSLDRVVNRGRRVRTGTLMGFVSLYVIGGLRPLRRVTLRHRHEMDHIGAWLQLATRTLPLDYDLAVETIACRRLVKGYSDTHSRGLSKFDRVLAFVPRLTGRPDGAAWLRRLRQAALVDEKGDALDGALRTVASVYG